MTDTTSCTHGGGLEESLREGEGLWCCFFGNALPCVPQLRNLLQSFTKP
jgi:hypothetical protein